MLLYDKEFENDSDLNENYKIQSYFHKDVKKSLNEMYPSLKT